MGRRKLQVANIYGENIESLLQNKSIRAGFVQSHPKLGQQTSLGQRNWFTDTLGARQTTIALSNGVPQTNAKCFLPKDKPKRRGRGSRL